MHTVALLIDKSSGNWPYSSATAQAMKRHHAVNMRKSLSCGRCFQQLIFEIGIPELDSFNCIPPPFH